VVGEGGEWGKGLVAGGVRKGKGQKMRRQGRNRPRPSTCINNEGVRGPSFTTSAEWERNEVRRASANARNRGVFMSTEGEGVKVTEAGRVRPSTHSARTTSTRPREIAGEG